LDQRDFLALLLFSVFHHLQKHKQCKQRHSLKLGKQRQESSKRYYYIISPRVMIKAIINQLRITWRLQSLNSFWMKIGNAATMNFNKH